MSNLLHLKYIKFKKMTFVQAMLPCLNKAMFGIDCPGCGAQRAFIMVVQGDFKSAFFMYPAIYTLLLLGLLLVVSKFYPFPKKNKLIYAFIGLNVLIITVSYIIKINQMI